MKPQGKYGVRLMTYWFDEDRGRAFCLMDSPARENVRQLHAEAHGLIPNKIVEVRSDAVEAFLGRIEDPRQTAPPSSAGGEPAAVDAAFRAVMFTDMKDSTASRPTRSSGGRPNSASFRTLHDSTDICPTTGEIMPDFLPGL